MTLNPAQQQQLWGGQEVFPPTFRETFPFQNGPRCLFLVQLKVTSQQFILHFLALDQLSDIFSYHFFSPFTLLQPHYLLTVPGTCQACFCLRAFACVASSALNALLQDITMTPTFTSFRSNVISKNFPCPFHLLLCTPLLCFFCFFFLIYKYNLTQFFVYLVCSLSSPTGIEAP